MKLSEEFAAFIVKEQLISRKDRLLLAVSGGLDSVVLCELCQLAGYDFVLAHCNFQLRGEESERDEIFVRGLGARYGKEVLVRRFDTDVYARERKVSIQVAARELRYAWFDSMLGEGDGSGAGASAGVGESGQAVAALLLTAHHQDDNIETLLMNFFKGTGVAGLRAMLPRQGRIVRPLLFADKSSLREFAEAAGLSWVEDSSNISEKYTRNYFRHSVIPLVETVYPQAVQNLAANIPRFREISQLYEQALAVHEKKLVRVRGEEVHIPVLQLSRTVPMSTVLYEIIRKYGFTPRQVQEVAALMQSGSGRYVLSGTHRILRDRAWLIITKLGAQQQEHLLIESPDDVAAFELGSLRLHLTPAPAGGIHPAHIPQDRQVALVDADALQFPLLLRRWKAGDYFYPLGLRKKKKLARFLIDNKLSLAQKERIWVLEADKKIVWVVGMRIDDRFKVGPATKSMLKITY